MMRDVLLLNETEVQVLRVLESANRDVAQDGRVRWHLDAEDICALLELGGMDADATNRILALLT